MRLDAGGAAVELLGVRFDALSEGATIAHVLDAMDGGEGAGGGGHLWCGEASKTFGEGTSGSGGWVVTANLDHLRRLVVDADYAALCAGASMVVADGTPLIWASRIQGTPLPERVAGSNLILSLAASAAREGRSVFLLGGEPGTAEEAAQILSARYPGLRVAGTHCPPVGFEKDPAEMALIEGTLVEAEPDIVYVALGSPKQEKLIARMRGRLPRAWWIGVGISFSFVCGRVRRAPRWMQRCGLEWLHRLIQEPRRLAKRYLVDDLPFAGHLLVSVVWRRFRGSGRSEEPSGPVGEVEGAACALPPKEEWPPADRS